MALTHTFPVKQLARVVALASVLLLAIPAAASAHVLRTDHGISAELHIEPYDHPVAGQQTSYIIAFENEPDTFTLRDYDTRMTITDSMGPHKTLSSKSLTETSPGESKNSFTFPMAMAYTLNVTGTPKHPAAGQSSFRLTYPIRVSAGTARKSSLSPWVAATIGIGIIVIIVAAIVMERSGKRPSGSTPN